MQSQKLARVKVQIWKYYHSHKRALSWRKNITPYRVLISEVMLQQTQVARVRDAFPRFLHQFPSIASLAKASPSSVLHVWQGLGYNRRALFLHRTAQTIVKDFAGRVPKNITDLEQLPGIGPATARSIAVFAWNRPEVFIETNIRRVVIHHFFPETENVSDAEVLPYVEGMLDRMNPREWYYAMMDYGTHLAARVPNPNRRSKHYTKQSRFQGSDRELRGKILQLLIEKRSLKRLHDPHKHDDTMKRLDRILQDLVKEGFIKKAGKGYTLV